MPNWKSYESSVRLLSAILAAHPELKLNYQEISKRFGGDCTMSALENRFRRVKQDAKAINEALANGIDPMTISVDRLNGKEKEIAEYCGDGSTAVALQHRFRPIKKDAKAMRDGIADKYGEGTTAKAVSTRFERLKKEPDWLTNNPTGNGGKQKNPSPRKKKTVENDFGGSQSDDEEDFGEAKFTPKKEKGNLNKTKRGRVTKPQTPKKNGQSSFWSAVGAIELNSDNENGLIKIEAHNDSYGNGFDAGNRGGNHTANPNDNNNNGYAAEYNMQGDDDDNEDFHVADAYRYDANDDVV